MQTRLTQLAETSEPALPDKLRSRIDEGLIMHEGHVVLAAELETGRPPQEFMDRTGFEAFVNHVHVDATAGSEEPHDLLVARAFARQVADLFIDGDFDGVIRIILARDEGEHPNSTVRFHILREGESWLADDLNSYSEPCGYRDVG